MLQIVRNPSDIELQLKLVNDLLNSDDPTHHLIAGALHSQRLHRAAKAKLEEPQFEIGLSKSSHSCPDEVPYSEPNI
jgi:hypothetical protein